MKETLLKDYKKTDYIIPDVDMYINILEKEVIVETTLTIKSNNDGENPLILNGKDLDIHVLEIDGKPVDKYTYSDDLLTIPYPGESFTLFSRVSIDPYNNKSLEGFYKSGEILCTQNEAEGFRRITFFLDRPDIMSRFTVTVEGDKKTYPYLLSNGNLTESKNIGEERHKNVWSDPFPKPCYLVAIVAGDLELVKDKYTTLSGRSIELQIYTDKGKGYQSQHAMESLKKSMKWDEDNFSLEYDLDLYMIVAVDSFNAGAMENKGLNIFNSVYVLADPETATDKDFEGVEGVIAHEYFHNWTGNRVTCRDWFQLTLKEGLTVFRDQEFSSDMTDRTVKRINDVSILRTHQFAEDRGPNSHPIKPKSYIEIDNFYTATVYYKGAEVIRMIHTIIGDENFKKGMKLYFERHDGEAVTTEDFVSAMSDASGINLDQFKSWYSQAGTPTLDIQSSYKNGTYKLIIKQQIPETSYKGERKPFYLPLNIGLYSSKGKDLTPTGRNQVIISKDEETFEFETGEDVIPSLLQNYSAPVIVNFNYSTEDLITLLGADKDDFNRFDSARRLAMNSVRSIINDLQKGSDPSVDKRIINSYKKLIKESKLDNRYLAALLYIPEVNNIAAEMEEYNYILATDARSKYAEILATELKGSLFRIFEDNVRDSYQFNKKAVGERSIKNRSLEILSYLNNDIREIAHRQFKTADNMTDYIAAYCALQRCDDQIREEVNTEFYNKWHKNPLVMDKWLFIQSARDSKNVLEDIRRLEQTEVFDDTNPNKIRSLYGAFAKANPKHFHSEDGAGYKFIADRIMKIDEFNSHASSSLASAFQSYRYLSNNQAELMKVELKRIVSKERISSGLFEIISKTIKARE